MWSGGSPHGPPLAPSSRSLACVGELLQAEAEEGERHVRRQKRKDEEVPAPAKGVDDRVVVRTKLSANADLSSASLHVSVAGPPGALELRCGVWAVVARGVCCFGVGALCGLPGTT